MCLVVPVALVLLLQGTEWEESPAEESSTSWNPGKKSGRHRGLIVPFKSRFPVTRSDILKVPCLPVMPVVGGQAFSTLAFVGLLISTAAPASCTSLVEWGLEKVCLVLVASHCFSG